MSQKHFHYTVAHGPKLALRDLVLGDVILPSSTVEPLYAR
jgi:hypothetical protein